MWFSAQAASTLARMGRHKTISDDAILGVARGVFRDHGHTATTRQIADAVGISEAVLYQRFGNKDDLFFAAMLPPTPDVDQLLGADDPTDDVHEYLRLVIVRLGRHFAHTIPLGLRLMSHPAFDPSRLGRTPPGGPPSLRDGFTARLEAFAKRGLLAPKMGGATARLLISLAHDWALTIAMSHGQGTPQERDLVAMVDVVWNGVAPK